MMEAWAQADAVTPIIDTFVTPQNGVLGSVIGLLLFLLWLQDRRNTKREEKLEAALGKRDEIIINLQSEQKQELKLLVPLVQQTNMNLEAFLLTTRRQ